MAGTVKAFNLPPDYVLYDMSYANTVMYGRTLPSFRVRKDRRKKDARQETVRMDDPKNRDRARQLLDTFR